MMVKWLDTLAGCPGPLGGLILSYPDTSSGRISDSSRAVVNLQVQGWVSELLDQRSLR